MDRRQFLALSGVWVTGAAGATIPRKAPELAVFLPGGRQLLLSSYRGKVVAVEFLLTTCPHCQRASSIMNKLYQELGPKGFQPLGYAVNDPDLSLVPHYSQRLALQFPVGAGPREQVLGFMQVPPAQPRMLMPMIAFIDKQGAIRAQYAGNEPFFNEQEEQNMRKQIESLLAEGAPVAKTSKSRKS